MYQIRQPQIARNEFHFWINYEIYYSNRNSSIDFYLITSSEINLAKQST